jgi:proteasome lid subunit RPN8/RPN11
MIIPRDILEHIFFQAAQEAPIEACGYLAGADRRVIRHYPMTNIDQSEEHFSFDPKEQFAAYKAARKDGLQIIGVYHSHPATPARPSAEDIRLAYDPEVVYVIISLLDGARTIKGFTIRQGKVEEKPLFIEENP